MKKLSELNIGDAGVIHSFDNDDIFLKLMAINTSINEKFEKHNEEITQI